MLQLLYPLGLLAVAGIVIPVIVHLWNIKNGKTLKIGSIALLGTPSNQRSRNFKVTDWPLLLLRCLLFLWIAFLLAQPLFSSKVSSSTHPGWVLVEKQHFPLLWKSNKRTLDSLVKLGYQIRDFNLGFQPLQLKDTATAFSKPAARPLSYFSLLKQFDVRVVPGSTVYLFTTNLLDRFEGEQPKINIDLQWKLLPVISGQASWLSAAFQLSNGDVRQQIAHSSAEGTFYRNNTVKKNTVVDITVDSAKLKVLVYGKDQSDVRYVKAAVQAISDFTERRVQVIEIQSLSHIDGRPAVVFWLSDQEIGQPQLNQLPAGSTLIQYAGGPKEKLTSVIRDQEGLTFPDVSLFQRTKFVGKIAQPVWTDGYGIPLLTVDTSRKIRHYQFYSHFNQNWTDLVWTNGMVRALMPLIFPGDGFVNDRRSQRVITELPQLLKVKRERSGGIIAYAENHLSNLFWWLLLVTFFIERLLTYQRVEGEL